MQPITNKHNLPPEIYRALSKNRYSSAGEDQEGNKRETDYSITTLIAPVQQTILRKRYPDANTEDAIDRVWTLFGSIAHALLEEHADENAIPERRIFITVLGRTISGAVDLYSNKKITDYKVTSAYKIKKQSFEEWKRQLNCYATLYESIGLEVQNLDIVAIIRDWSESKTYEKNYPEIPIAVIPILKWSEGARMRYIEERVRLLVINEDLPDECLMQCTDEERWMETVDYAYIKPGATKAYRKYETLEEAQANPAPGCELIERKSKPRRCMNYCNVSTMCNQFQQYLKENGNEPKKQEEIEG